jgi:hypothetical protein
VLANGLRDPGGLGPQRCISATLHRVVDNEGR